MLAQMSIDVLNDQSPSLYDITRGFILQNRDILGRNAHVISLERTPEGEFCPPESHPSSESGLPREIVSLHVEPGKGEVGDRWFLNSSNNRKMQYEVSFNDKLPVCVAYDMGTQNQLIQFRVLDQEATQEKADLIITLLSHPDTIATIVEHRSRLMKLQKELTHVVLKMKKGTPSYPKLITRAAELKRQQYLQLSSVSSQRDVVAKVSGKSYTETFAG